MNEDQQDLRSSATEAFHKSLKELQDLLESKDSPIEESEPPIEDEAESNLSELDWEEAAADLEQFFKENDEE